MNRNQYMVFVLDREEAVQIRPSTPSRIKSGDFSRPKSDRETLNDQSRFRIFSTRYTTVSTAIRVSSMYDTIPRCGSTRHLWSNTARVELHLRSAEQEES